VPRFVAASLSLLLAGCLQHSAADSSARPPTPPPTEPGRDGGGETATTDGDLGDAAYGDADATADGDAPGDGGESAPDPMELEGSASTSVGGPNDGSLRGGVPFPRHAPGARLNPRRLSPGGHHGTVEMVQALLRAAKVVHDELPGGEMTVNDLSFAEGGPIPHHGSHRAGRDADVLFYLLDREGNPIPSKGVPLDTRGRGWDFNDLMDPEDDVRVKIDVPRTWRYLQALAEDEQSNLQRVFVAEHLRTILVAHGKRVRAPRAARQRVELLTCQPGTPHDDHFHFRFFCTPEDMAEGCLDSPPVYPFRRQQLAALDLSPAIAPPRRRRPRSKTTSRAKARTDAGAMHWKVKAFLDLRETWSKQPHPGRPYCR